MLSFRVRPRRGRETDDMRNNTSLWALAGLVPAPSIGTLAAMELFPGTALGNALFLACKIWLFVFPLAWLVFVDRGRIGFSPVRKGGWRAGVVSGILLGLAILFLYVLFGKGRMDTELFAEQMRKTGLDTWPAFLGGALYWIGINSLLEEYAWRWFVYRKCEALVGPAAAIPLTAFFFSLHHAVALQSYGSISFAVMGSAGVFLGGVVWSFLYRRYRSIWPGYVSHALVDAAVFGLGAAWLFSAP